jgi:hypothetical protein
VGTLRIAAFGAFAIATACPASSADVPQRNARYMLDLTVQDGTAQVHSSRMLIDAGKPARLVLNRTDGYSVQLQAVPDARHVNWVVVTSNLSHWVDDTQFPQTSSHLLLAQGQPVSYRWAPPPVARKKPFAITIRMTPA